MDFSLNETQRAVVEAIDSAVERQGRHLPGSVDKYVTNPEFVRELREQGYWDIVDQDDLGLFGAVLMIESLSRSPYCLETTGSVLVWPMLGRGEAPEAVALVVAPATGPIRFAMPGASLVVIEGDEVRIASLGENDVQAVESHFAYPLGRVDCDKLEFDLAAGVDAGELRERWSIGAAAEIVGAATAALDITLQHVKDRILFGKPLGALQVVQHRLSICKVAIAATQKLVYRAALRPHGPNPALALAQAQETAVKVSQECQQFHGAIGLTLEHPLHHWTYRLKFLATEIGGGPASLERAAERTWPAGQAISDPLADVEAAWI